MNTNVNSKLPTIAVLGSTGMLGRAIAGTRFEKHDVLELNRAGKPTFASNRFAKVNSDLSDIEKSVDFSGVDFVVNCAGLIRQKIDESDLRSIISAVESNFLIPVKLLALSEKYGFKIIQIGTDCVYSGNRGGYVESDFHDSFDIYGKSKSLGEIPHQNMGVLRTSIVGLEGNSTNSLLSWLLSQKHGAAINGFNDQLWNGITVLHFAKIVAGIVDNNLFSEFSGLHHIVPANALTKETILVNFASVFNRTDLEIRSVASGRNLNMTLGTLYPVQNQLLWKLAGYEDSPTIEQMILEYSLSTRLGDTK